MRVHPIVALFSVAAFGIAVPARGDESPAKTDKARSEVQKERKELKDKLDENRAELKEKSAKLSAELKEKRDELNKEANEKRGDLKEALAKLRETRTERRKADRDALREKYGELLNQPVVHDELKIHASRLARLNQIKRLAGDQKKNKWVDRADKLIERENTRHDTQMTALKDNGGKTSAAENRAPATAGQDMKGGTK